MSEERRRLASILSGRGIELGALHRPLEVPPGASVTYVDKVPVEVLREHYKTLEDSEIAPVEVLGSAEDLSVFPDGSQDFVIANHLIEHLEDPIRALEEFQRVLRRRGLLYMCVPDSRVTFDRTRPLTPVEHLVAEHRGGPEAVAANRRAHYADWVANVSDVGHMEEVAKPMPPERQEAQIRELMEMDYSIHFHCWTGETFLAFMDAMRSQQGLELEVLASIDTTPLGRDELIVLAARAPTRSQRRRARELAAGVPEPAYAQQLRARQSRLWTALKSRLRASPAGPALVIAYRRLRRHP